MAEIVIATCDALPDLDPDDQHLAQALEHRGHQVSKVSWRGERAAFESAEIVVVRNPWDYPNHREAFLDWARHVEQHTRLENPAAVLSFNSDKTYLQALAASDFPVVPTLWLRPDSPDPEAQVREHYEGQSHELVFKPSVSAGAKRTYRRALDAADWPSQVGTLLQEGWTMMVQPYLSSVDLRGESALFYFDGRYSHAIEKGPILKPNNAPPEGLFVAESKHAYTPSAEEQTLASAVLDWTKHTLGLERPLLYARVDIVRDDAGALRILELELTEPSMFLALSEGAAGRFADAVERALG